MGTRFCLVLALTFCLGELVKMSMVINETFFLQVQTIYETNHRFSHK